MRGSNGDTDWIAAKCAIPFGVVGSRNTAMRVIPGAIAFVVRIGFFAECADHHPDLDVRWKRVRVALSTHDAGGLTEKDLDLAREIEGIRV